MFPHTFEAVVSIGTVYLNETNLVQEVLWLFAIRR